MTDIIAEIFGYVVLAIAVGLAGWEYYVYRRPDVDVSWLQTPARFRRRLIMAVLLVGVGVLIVCEARGLLVLDNVRHLVMYVSSLTALAMILLILSVRDLGDMAHNAEKQAIEELQMALQSKSETGSSSGPQK